MSTRTVAYVNTRTVAQIVDASFRQLDYWARCGYIDVPSRGSGCHRRWTAFDVEVAYALVQSSKLGQDNSSSGTGDLFGVTARAMKARPVAHRGEWLVIIADGTAQRFDKLLLDDLTHFEAARVIRLRSFADVFAGAA